MGDIVTLPLDKAALARSMMIGQLATAQAARDYILGGDAYFTLRSKKTGTRFTYHANAPENDGGMRFLAVLTGPANEEDYRYFGYIRGAIFHFGRKSKISMDAPSVIAFRWAWNQLDKGKLPGALEIWHEGRCGRCGRKLTVPESIANGFGPECVKHIPKDGVRL